MSTEPLSPPDVDRHVRRLLNGLESDVEELRRIGRELAAAEADYKLIRARARTVARGNGMSVADADDRADIEASDAFRIYRMADQSHKAQREACEAHRAQLIALQSLQKGLRQLT